MLYYSCILLLIVRTRTSASMPKPVNAYVLMSKGLYDDVEVSNKELYAMKGNAVYDSDYRG